MTNENVFDFWAKAKKADSAIGTGFALKIQTHHWEVATTNIMRPFMQHHFHFSYSSTSFLVLGLEQLACQRKMRFLKLIEKCR